MKKSRLPYAFEGEGMELVGLAEVAQLLSTTKQVIVNWRSRKEGFPQPIAELKSGPVWSKEAIIDWAVREEIDIDEEIAGIDTKNGIGETRRAIIVSMMNMKGGVGKSTLSANLGWYFAYRANKRVLLVDLDPQFNLSQYILGAKGYENILDAGKLTVESLFRDLKSGAKPTSLREAITEVVNYRDGSYLHIVPASLELAWTIKTAVERSHVLRDYLNEVRPLYDVIIIDCSPTESVLSTASYLAADYIFIPVKPEFLSTIGLPLLLRSMKEFQDNYRTESLPELGGIIFNDTSEKVEHDRSRDYVRRTAAEQDWYVFENEISHSDSYPAGARAGKPIFMTDNARSWKKDELTKVGREFLKRIGL